MISKECSYTDIKGKVAMGDTRWIWHKPTNISQRSTGLSQHTVKLHVSKKEMAQINSKITSMSSKIIRITIKTTDMST